jgi:hypothetical protein
VSPFEPVRVRLDERGCDPHGPERQFQARCPAHEDRVASLSVGLGDDGRVLMYCHAGCSFERILEALNLTWSDLYPQDNSRNGTHSEIVVTYPYVDEHGELLFEVVRKTGKKFGQRRPDGSGGWIWKLGATRRVLYRLPRVLASGVMSTPRPCAARTSRSSPTPTTPAGRTLVRSPPRSRAWPPR